MKKILFLLLLTTASYGQALFDKGVKITGGITTDASASKVVVQSTNNILNTIPKTDLQDAFYFATASALPVVGITDKLYITRDDNKLYRFDGTVYQPLSTDISNLVTLNTPQTITALKTIKDTYLRIVNDNVPNPRGLAVFQNNSSAAGAQISFNKSRGTNASPTAGAVNDIIGLFEFKPYVGSAYTSDRSSFGASMTSTTGISVFFTAGNANNNFTPSLLVHENKKVGVGALGGTILSGLTAPSAMLHVRSLGTTTDSALLIENSAGTDIIDTKDNGLVAIPNTLTVGGTANDGINKVQVNGTIKASPAVTDDQVPNLGQVKLNNIQTTGPQTATGRKTFVNTDTVLGGLTITNNRTTNDQEGTAILIQGSGRIGTEINGSNEQSIRTINTRASGIGIVSNAIGASAKSFFTNLYNNNGIGYYAIQDVGGNSIPFQYINQDLGRTTQVNVDGTISGQNATENSHLITLGQVRGSQGWANYADTQYTVSSPFSVAGGTTVTLPNNAGTTINTYIPTGVTSFYNSATSKITPNTLGDAYTINVRFSAKTSMNNDFLEVGIDIGNPTTVTAETKPFLKGANNEQKFNFVFPVFSLATFLANGGLIKVTSGSGTLSIYNITYFITRTYKPL